LAEFTPPGTRIVGMMDEDGDLYAQGYQEER
jgi:hypothetical protein